ncbi:MAG: FHA domain-containing protein, partial [Planctomycetaceae bacterium]|nr:FHA domain-containing protein [Planctomycetaceae bacterium]
MIFPVIKQQVSENATLAEIEPLVRMNVPSEEVVAEILNRFQSELKSRQNRVAAPRLLVDWGELPRVGYQVRSECTLICPGYEQCRPEVRVIIDRELDHSDSSLRRVHAEEPGLWSFQIPFRMTSDQMDCRPGQYLIEVDLAFRDVPADLPRFYRCRIRLNVSDANATEGGVLEIDGDGQSMVNLQGYNLKQFSKVILKGGGDSVINLQDALGGTFDASSHISEKPETAFEYQLKVDTEKQLRLPVVANAAHKRAYLDACGLFFEDGRRTLLFARLRITLGRSRDNDIIIRFLPSSKQNDNYSRSISRTHCIAELIPEGIELQDESNRGIEVNYRIVQGRELIPATFAGDVVHLELGVTGSVPQKFELEMALFGPDKRFEREELEYWDELYCEVIGGRMSRLHREALNVGLDAVRYDRITSLSGEESYVHLFREALLGGSPAQSAII